MSSAFLGNKPEIPGVAREDPVAQRVYLMPFGNVGKHQCNDTDSVFGLSDTALILEYNHYFRCGAPSTM